MASTEKQKLITQVRQFAETLYLIDAKEMGVLLKNIEYFPKEALLQTLDLLKQAKETQDKILRNLVSKDPSFNEGLKSFLHKEYQNYAKQSGLAELESAEKLLTGL